MKICVKFSGLLLGLLSLAASSMVWADQTVRCESKDYRYQECRIGKHGYIRLTRQLSRSDCIKGRTWDYDRRHIWVDDGCAAEFLVESRHHTDDHSDHKGEKAAAAVAAVALIAAAVAANSDNSHNKHHDEDYGHGGHASYVPGWMIGDFLGYNEKRRAEIAMTIKSDGRVSARVNGTPLTGYVNDERLYIGDAEFYLERAGNGFNTIQVGNHSNQVHYQRR